MFSVASTSTNLASLPVGLFLDNFGSKWTLGSGAALFTLGSLLFGFSSSTLPLYTVGYVLLAIGGPFIYIGSLNLAMAFPSQSGLIMAALTGAFDASSFIFFGFQFLPLSVHDAFKFYAIFPALVCILLIVFLPKKPFGTHEDGPLTCEDLEDESCPLLLPERKSISSQLLSGNFIGVTFVLCVFMAKLNFYISTMSHQIEEISADSETLLKWFNLLLPMGGIVSIPFVGFLLDFYSFPVNFTLVSLVGIMFSILGLIPSLPLQYISIFFFVLMRPFIYALTGSFCSKMFSVQDFGTIYGVMNMMGGIFNLTQYPLTFLAIDMLGKSFWLSNLIVLVLTVLTLGFPVYLHSKRAWKVDKVNGC